LIFKYFSALISLIFKKNGKTSRFSSHKVAKGPFFSLNRGDENKKIFALKWIKTILKETHFNFLANVNFRMSHYWFSNIYYFFNQFYEFI